MKERVKFCTGCRSRMDIYMCTCSDRGAWGRQQEDNRNVIEFVIDPGLLPYREDTTKAWRKFLRAQTNYMRWIYIGGYPSLQYNIYDMYKKYGCLSEFNSATPSADGAHIVKKSSVDWRYVVYEEESIAKIASGAYLKFMFAMGQDGKTMEYFCNTFTAAPMSESLECVKAYRGLIKKLKKITGHTFMIHGQSEHTPSRTSSRRGIDRIRTYHWATTLKLAPSLMSIPGTKEIV